MAEYVYSEGNVVNDDVVVMSKEYALKGLKRMYDDIDKDNHLFVGTINPEMIKVAINCIEQVIRLDNIARC